MNEASVFMHELGHNLGLDHAGDASTPDFKPNFLSVMNLNFTYPGICSSNTAGSTVVSSCRVDYSNAKLPTLDENHLDENKGISAGTNDITTYNCPDFTPVLGPGTGPIDWNCNGDRTEPDVAADINAEGNFTPLTGFRDWGALNFAFQCTRDFADAPDRKSTRLNSSHIQKSRMPSSA